jgi:hypothetical protein
MFAATYDANFNHKAVNRSATRPFYRIFLLSDLPVLSNDPSQVTPILTCGVTVLTSEVLQNQSIFNV